MIALVTGSNRGIGLEFCKQLKEKGFEVLALCRHSSQELSQLDVNVYEGFDMGQDSVIDKIKDLVGSQKLDLVINNAGIMIPDTWDAFDSTSLEEQFNINAIGPLRVARAVEKMMVNNGKIAMITSRMGSIADNSSGGSYGYRMSKAALNAAGKSLALDYRNKGISVALLHPGWVKTDMTGNNGQISTTQSVNGLLKIIENMTLDSSGHFWHTNGESLPW